MTKSNLYQQSKKEIKAVFQAVSNKTGLPAFAVEKDWWVVQTLALIFETKVSSHLVFKGGTSLSKAWGIIERFSEDVDLAVDRTFFGFDGDLSKKQRTELRKTTGKYISASLNLELMNKFDNRGLKDVEIKVPEPVSSDQDPRIIEIYYPNIIEPQGYMQPRVLVEIGGRSLREPFTVRTFTSLVSEYFPDRFFTQLPINIPSVNPERTFLEKLFLLHEEFQRPKGKIRVNRLSRHLYDIYRLIKTGFADKAIADKVLYENIVKHRHSFTRMGGVDYNLHQPQTINPLPIKELISDWRNDYKTLQEQMIYGDSPGFDDMLDEIRTFVDKLNKVAWKMDIIF